MCVDPAESRSPETRRVDEAHDFIIVHRIDVRERAKMVQGLHALAERAACELTENERMNRDRAGFEKRLQPRAPIPEMVHPHGRVSEDHAYAGLMG